MFYIQDVDFLLELKKKSTLDITKQKTEYILDRCLKEDSFRHFEELSKE